MNTFYWYDYETFGLKPQFQRIAQFAGIRTDENLNILDEHMFYCKPTHDCLPSPDACAVTGITPQHCEKIGLIEHEFIQKINWEFSKPNTCIVGYNSIAFDDEFTRHTLYRNFLDPYAWHWKNGNTRWDILKLVRFCYAHKYDSSLNWVIDDNNKPIFKLDRLAPTNGIEHSDAHDAMADVRATIGIAKIIKDTQPRLFKYALSLRDKNYVKEQIKPLVPFLHTSGSYPAKLSCTRLTTVLTNHPDYSNCVIVFNLEQDPSLLVELDPEELTKLRFSKNLPKNVERLQTKELKFNQSPMFIYHPDIISNSKLLEILQIDMEKCIQHLDYIKKHESLIRKNIQTIYKADREPSVDVDQSIYDKFISDEDRKLCNKIQKLSLDQMSSFKPDFEDKKLSKLFLNFKARNYPETLTEDEQEDWFEIVQSRVQSGENGYLSIEHFEKSLKRLKEDDPNRSHLWQELEEYANRLL